MAQTAEAAALLASYSLPTLVTTGTVLHSLTMSILHTFLQICLQGGLETWGASDVATLGTLLVSAATAVPKTSVLDSAAAVAVGRGNGWARVAAGLSAASASSLLFSASPPTHAKTRLCECLAVFHGVSVAVGYLIAGSFQGNTVQCTTNGKGNRSQTKSRFVHLKLLPETFQIFARLSLLSRYAACGRGTHRVLGPPPLPQGLQTIPGSTATIPQVMIPIVHRTSINRQDRVHEGLIPERPDAIQQLMTAGRL